MSKQKVAFHLPHYLPLFAIFAFTVIGFKYFAYDNSFRKALALSASASYFTWGVVHHIIHKDFDKNIFLEYLGLSLLGLVILLSIIPN